MRSERAIRRELNALRKIHLGDLPIAAEAATATAVLTLLWALEPRGNHLSPTAMIDFSVSVSKRRSLRAREREGR